MSETSTNLCWRMRSPAARHTLLLPSCKAAVGPLPLIISCRAERERGSSRFVIRSYSRDDCFVSVQTQAARGETALEDSWPWKILTCESTVTLLWLHDSYGHMTYGCHDSTFSSSGICIKTAKRMLGPFERQFQYTRLSAKAKMSASTPCWSNRPKFFYLAFTPTYYVYLHFPTY